MKRNIKVNGKEAVPTSERLSQIKAAAGGPALGYESSRLVIDGSSMLLVLGSRSSDT